MYLYLSIKHIYTYINNTYIYIYIYIYYTYEVKSLDLQPRLGHESEAWLQRCCRSLLSSSAVEDWQRINPFLSETEVRSRLDILHTN